MMGPESKKKFAHCTYDRPIALKYRNYVPKVLKVPWWWGQINYKNSGKSYAEPKECNLVTIILANDNEAECCCGDCNKLVAIKGGIILPDESTKGALLCTMWIEKDTNMQHVATRESADLDSYS
eukprot:8325914-Ditylum_brightwellii.AAC.1